VPRPIKAKKLPDGRWVIRFQSGDKMKREYFRTEFAADERIAEIERLRSAAASHVSERGDILTVSDYWIDTYVKEKELSWSVAYKAQCDQNFDKWINPYLGGYALNEVTRAVAQEWVTWMVSEQGANPPTVSKAVSIASGFFGHAIDNGVYVIGDRLNPMHHLTLPRHRAAKPPHSLDLVEVFQIKKYLVPESSLAVSLHAFCGLRNGEAHASMSNPTGLEWPDLVDVRSGKVRELLRLEGAKTLAGDRDLDLWQLVRQEIADLWEARKRPKSGSIFLSAKKRDGRYEPLQSRAFHKYRWDPALLAAGYEIDEIEVHDLRDVTSNMLARAHWSLADAAAYLGHGYQVHEKTYLSQFRIARRKPQMDPDDQLAEATAQAGYKGLLEHEADWEASLPLQRLYNLKRTRGVKNLTRAKLVAELKREEAKAEETTSSKKAAKKPAAKTAKRKTAVA
jgi:hypothetical protein